MIIGKKTTTKRVEVVEAVEAAERAEAAEEVVAEAEVSREKNRNTDGFEVKQIVKRNFKFSIH